MKTKEFIDKVKELDYGCTIDGHYIVVSDDYGTPVTISRYKMYYITMETDDDKLGELSYEYARTPIEEREREEEKSYYLRKINKKFYEGEYLSHDIKYNRWLLGDNIENAQYTTKFTWKEIEVIKKEFNTELCEFVKEVAE